MIYKARTNQKTWSDFRWSGNVGSSCSTSKTRRVTFVTNSVINHEGGKDRIVITIKGTWTFVTQIYRNG